MAVMRDAMRLLFWESTYACNLDCAHCRRDQGIGRTNDLSTEQAMAMIGQAAALGPPLLVLSGGEPLLRPDWEAICAHASRVGVPVAMASNGTLIDDAIAARIRAAGIRRVSISLDGADAATHEGLRGIPGSFAGARGGIAALRRAGVPVQVNCTITRRNRHQLDDLLALVKGDDVCALHLFLLVPVGCGAQIAAADMLDPEATDGVLEWLVLRQRDAGIELRSTCAPQYRRVATRLARRDGVPPPRPGEGGCLAGRSILFVDHKGQCRPCGYLPLSAGDLTRQSVGEVWRDSPLLDQVADREHLHEGCGDCGWRDQCGGCRARAYGTSGDLMGPEPTCTVTARGGR